MNKGNKDGGEANVIRIRRTAPILAIGTSVIKKSVQNEKEQSKKRNVVAIRNKKSSNGNESSTVFVKVVAHLAIGGKTISSSSELTSNSNNNNNGKQTEPKNLTTSFSSLVQSLSKITGRITGNSGKGKGNLESNSESSPPLRLQSVTTVSKSAYISSPPSRQGKKRTLSEGSLSNSSDSSENQQPEENSSETQIVPVRKTRFAAQTESLNRAIQQREAWLKEAALIPQKTKDREKKDRRNQLLKERRKKEKEKEKAKKEKEEAKKKANKEKGDKIISKKKGKVEKESEKEAEKSTEKKKRRKLNHVASPSKSAINIDSYPPEVQEVLRRNSSVVDLIELIFDQLPDGHRISKKEELITNNANHNLDGFGSSTYGEILPVAIHNIISLLEIGENDVFYDLGSGIGKAVIQIAMQTKCKKSVGVELSETRYNVSLEAKDDTQRRLQMMSKDKLELLTPRRAKTSTLVLKEIMDSIEFINNDILQIDFSDATCIYWNNICFNAQASFEIVSKFNQLPEGTKVLCSRKLCGRHSAACLRKQEPCSFMYLTKKDLVSCTWAVSCTVFIYEVRKRIVVNWWDQ